jgi:hypothetical protein
VLISETDTPTGYAVAVEGAVIILSHEPAETPAEPPVDNYKAPENYEEYIAMSGEDQLRFINSFPSTDAFLEWVSAARAEYEASSDKTPIGPDGEVDVSGN